MPIKPLKIAFVGTCCSGKTTIFEHLRKAHGNNPKIHFVAEAAREVLASNPHFLKNRFCIEAQRAIIQQIIKNELLARRDQKEIIVCDRSIIDSFVYMHSTGRQQDVEILYRETAHWIPSYNQIVLFNPHEIPYQQDAVRTESLEKRMALHDAYLEFFALKKIPYSLLSGPKQVRIRKMKKLLG
jgi:predicted ATPase